MTKATTSLLWTEERDTTHLASVWTATSGREDASLALRGGRRGDLQVLGGMSRNQRLQTC